MRSPQKKISASFLSSVSIGLLFLTFALCRIRPIYWEDVWWHLATGKYIVQHQGVPRFDIFSWTMHGARWINMEWLYQVILYGFVRLMGLAGVIFFKTILILAAFYFLDCRLRIWKARALERLFFLGLAFMGGWPFWVERADLGSLAFLSALFFCIDRAEDDPGAWRYQGLLWVFLFMAWANTHGMFLLGLFVLGLRGLFELGQHPAVGRRILLWTALGAAATLVNPNGIGLITGVYRLLTSHVGAVGEWGPAAGLGFLFFYISVAVMVLCVVLTARWSREDFYALLIALAFAVHAFYVSRFVHFFMVCGFPYAARQWLKSPARIRCRNQLGPWEWPALSLTAILLFTAAVAAAHQVRGGISAGDSGYIKEACDFIQSQKVQGPFFNEYKFGSYWIMRFEGHPPVFQDGRHGTVLGYSRLIDDCIQARQSAPAWIAFLNRLGVNAAVVKYPSITVGIRPSVLDRFFPNDAWGLVYWDDWCLLFVRRIPSHAALLSQWEYRVLKPDWTLDTYIDRLRRGLDDRSMLRTEIERNLSSNPGCWRARVDLHWLEAIPAPRTLQKGS